MEKVVSQQKELEEKLAIDHVVSKLVEEEKRRALEDAKSKTTTKVVEKRKIKEEEDLERVLKMGIDAKLQRSPEVKDIEKKIFVEVEGFGGEAKPSSVKGGEEEKDNIELSSSTAEYEEAEQKEYRSDQISPAYDQPPYITPPKPSYLEPKKLLISPKKEKKPKKINEDESVNKCSEINNYGESLEVTGTTGGAVEDCSKEKLVEDLVVMGNLERGVRWNERHVVDYVPLFPLYDEEEFASLIDRV
ncbi:hypothetical protein L2E82_48031 [Cichorium intybus]|uniref:Uncharacterized protein n=1 Tax=Cichorium intybus TaxID=13427 RepID=A0ACB8YY84_CICIN|nr:hypothetical protein L2E82_48031 [Cichorium intybus]